MSAGITFEQSLASVIRYMQDNMDEGVMAYYDEIPENYYVPSVYYQVPSVSTKKVTLSAWLVTLSVNIWFMDRRDWDANARAAAIRNTMLLDGLNIPYVDEDGNDMVRHMHATEPSMQKIDEGIIQLSFEVKDYFSKEDVAEQVPGFILSWGKAAE